MTEWHLQSIRIPFEIKASQLGEERALIQNQSITKKVLCFGICVLDFKIGILYKNTDEHTIIFEHVICEKLTAWT